MNHTYRLVWSDSQAAYVAVPEFASRRGKATGLRAAGVVLASILAFNAHALPAGGQVSAGQGNIAQSGSAMTVKQQSQNLAINWQTFGIGAGEFVTFSQPNASAIALNRVLGADPTQIYGRLTANGQVWLLNPNGVLFGGGAQVNVGGLVASTLNLSDADFLAGKRTFSGSGGNVTNQGSLTSSDGGYVSLLGGKVSNEGVIQARLGSVALGAGSQITLNFAGGQLLGLQIDKGVVDALVQNKQLIRADGGTVLMSAKAADALLGTVVNNEGVIEARTIDARTGTIRLLGASGAVQVSGTLDASAPSGGDGGFIETSGERVKVIDGAVITTAAPSGQTGQWLIDPQDYTVAVSGGDITGSALGTALGSSNVQIQSSSGSTAGAGDVSVNDAVTWSANTTLTLTASNNVNVNASITAIGASAGIAINPNTANGSDAASGGGIFTLGTGAAINLPNVSPNSATALIIGGVRYTVINNLGVPGSASGADLQGMQGNLTGRYALGSNIDASATSGWNGGAGFAPVGDASGAFSGFFDGLGHTITGLTIARPGASNVGLFGQSTGSVRNIGLVGGTVSADVNVGTLVGYTNGAISNAYATSTVYGVVQLGGLVGYSDGSIADSYATGAVSGSASKVGGLVGVSNGTIVNSHATGSVSGNSHGGGLVGINGGTIINAYATGDVTTNGSSGVVGGLAGYANGTISNAYATGSVSGSSFAGGLVGYNSGAVISNAYATGNVTGDSYVGGLAGYNNRVIRNAYATGTPTGNQFVGGLVGANDGVIFSGYWNNDAVGFGVGSGSADGTTGLSMAQMHTASSFAGFNFTSSPGAGDNNWVLVDTDGTLDGVSGATTPLLASEYSVGIGNAHQLQLMAMSPSAAYRMRADVDASGTGSGRDVWGSSGFIPVQNFTGTFDGSDQTISGLTIMRPSANYVGLFGQNFGLLQNVGVVSGVFNGNQNVGALAGYNAGTITNSHSTGTVSGWEAVGGLVGLNQGTVANSRSGANVRGVFDTGGLVGSAAWGTISASHAEGSVSGGSNGGSIGGLVGYAAGGTIDSVYANGNVSGNDAVGGLVGGSVASISNAHASGAVQGNHVVGGLIGANAGAIRDVIATGNVSGTSDVGGLVGWNEYSGGGYSGYSRGTVTGAHATGIVTGSERVGGMVGRNDGAITSAYATGSVSGSSAVGGLVGANATSGSITSAYATGNVSGSLELIGGLVGSDEGGTLRDVFATGSVAGTYFVGGLAGKSFGAINNAYATGNVTGTSELGGLLGRNLGAVSNAYATGNVVSVDSGAPFIGGLAGVNDGSISNAYAIGSVAGGSRAGGLVGFAERGSISNTYATGSVSGSWAVGGLIGHNGTEGTVANSYWNSDVNATGIGVGGTQGAAGLTAQQMRTTGKLAGFQFTSSPGAGGNNWVLIDTDGSLNNAGGVPGATLPMLASEYSPAISNVHQLQLMAMSPYATFTLKSDINASNTGRSNDVWDGAGFVPVPNFSGVFDGQGHTITGLTINRPSSSYVGLFGRNFGSIGNVGLLGGAVNGSENVGELVGYSGGGTIANVYATGVVSGSGGVGGLVGINGSLISNAFASGSVTGGTGSSIGGLVGFNGGTIRNAFAIGNVRGNLLIGGLVGDNIGTISNAYASGAVSGAGSGGHLGGLAGHNGGRIVDAYASGVVAGNFSVGGLVGWNDGIVLRTYSTGHVSSASCVGGLIGCWSSGNVSASFWDVETSGLSFSFGGFGLTTAKMQAQTSYPGWDFLNTWHMPSGDYPILLNSPLVLRVTANDAKRTYGDGNPTFTEAITGFWGSDTSSLIAGLTSTTVATAGSNVASYYIMPGNGSATSSTGLPYRFAYFPGTLTVEPRPVTVTGSRTYDGTATVDGSVLSLGNVVNNDTVSLTGTGSLADKNVGREAVVSFSGLALSSSNYTLAGASGLVNITPAPLTIAASTDSRAYDGTMASSAMPTVTGLITGDSVSGTAQAFASKNVLGANGSTLQVTGYTVNDGNGGANYTVSAPNAAGTITPAALTITTSPVAKTYDGSTSASGTAVVSAGQLFGTDSISGGSFAYTDKNAGTGKTVTVSGVSVNDGNGGADYLVSYLSNTSSTINKAPLTVTANNAAKTYDSLAFSGGTGVTYAGFVSGETPSALGGTLTYGGSSQGAANAGSYSIVPGGYTAGNYSIGYFAGTLTVNPKPVSASISGTTTKVYDGNGAATVANSAYVLSGFVGSQSATVNQTAGNYNSKNVDQANTVMATLGSGTFTAGPGTLLSNYLLPTSASGIGTITPATLTYLANATTMSKGDAVPALSGTVTGFVGADTLTKATTGTLSWFTNASSSSKAGSYFINGTGLTANHGNYVFVQAPSNASALTVVNCTPTKTKTCP